MKVVDLANVSRRSLLNFGRVIRSVSRRYGVQVAARFAREVLRYQTTIDLATLRSAIASGNLQTIEAAIRASALQQSLERNLRQPFQGVTAAAGTKSAATLRTAGIAADFRTTHPNVILAARQHAGDLVVGIPAQTRKVIGEVIAAGAEFGLTVDQQARALREVVGLPPNWSSAPIRLEQEILSNDPRALRRRSLTRADRRRIREAMAETIPQIKADLAFNMRAIYAQRLIQKRAMMIARTETLRAAHAGLHESWQQARQQGVLPDRTRRFWIVTPDERLSIEHSRIPGMNPQGRGLNDPFFTTEGTHMYPPSRPNCRCSVALLFPPPGTTVIDTPPGGGIPPGPPITGTPPTVPSPTIPTGTPPVKTPFEMFSEGIERDFGVRVVTKTARDRQWALETENEFRGALSKVRDRYGSVPIKEIRYVDFKTEGWPVAIYEDAMGLFSRPPLHSPTAPGIIRINTAFTPEETAYSQHAGFMKKFFSTGEFEALWRHELTHAAHHLRDPMFYAGLGESLTPTQMATALRVSRYAATNAFEFVAEVGSALLDGKVFDAEVMRLYKKFGGPPIL